MPPPHRLPVWGILAATTATQSLTTLGVLALATLAPSAARELGISPALVGYQVGVVYLGALSSALVGGRLPQRLGATRTGQVALVVVGLGCLLSVIGTLATLALGAFVMGLGYGLTNPAASHLLARVPTAERMNLIFSIKQSGVPIGGILAGTLLPPIALTLGWQAGLVACALLMAALAVGMEPVRPGWDADRLPGMPLLTAPLAAIALIWRHPVLRWLALASFAYSGVQLSLTGFLVTYLVAEAGLSLVAAGSIMAITNAAGAAGRLAWGWLADRARSGSFALMANGVVAMLGALATASVAADWPLWAIAVATAIFGFAAIGWNGVFMAVIARQVPRQDIGIATGGSLGITYAGVIAGPTAFALLHDEVGVSYGGGYALLALVTAVGIACVIRARLRRPR